MTIVEPVAARLQAIMATTPVVERGPIPQDAARKLDEALRELCADMAAKLCIDECPEVGTETEERDRMLLKNVSVAETLAHQIAALQQLLWAKAEKAGISKTAVAKARDVTQQAHSQAMKPSKKTQQR